MLDTVSAAPCGGNHHVVHATIASDQQRIRENIQALGSARQERALRERYTRELNAQEDQLRELQAQIAKLSTERDLRRAELSRLMQKLTFEVNVK